MGCSEGDVWLGSLSAMPPVAVFELALMLWKVMLKHLNCDSAIGRRTYLEFPSAWCKVRT